MINHLQVAKDVLSQEIKALELGRDTLSHAFTDAVKFISEIASCGGRVVVLGVGKSGHIGNKIAATLASTGTPAFFVHPSEAGHGDLGMITDQDIVILISQSGKTSELLKIIPYFKRHGISMISMTGSSDSALAKYSDIVISTKVLQEACPLGLAPTASTTLTLALGDALAVCLLKAKDFREEDFAITHPHGSLGRRLLLATRDVMTESNNAPLIEPNRSVRNALIDMSKGGMGFLIIVDARKKVMGVFTDGDLRRCLDQDLDIKATVISDVMNKEFVVIKESQLAVEAVDLMERNKISALPVVNDLNVITGAINMRQLLQAGVV